MKKRSLFINLTLTFSSIFLFLLVSKAIAIDPNYSEAHFNRGSMYGRTGERDVLEGKPEEEESC